MHEITEWVAKHGFKQGDVIAHFPDTETEIRLGEWLEPGGWSFEFEYGPTFADMNALMRLVAGDASAQDWANELTEIQIGPAQGE